MNEYVIKTSTIGQDKMSILDKTRYTYFITPPKGDISVLKDNFNGLDFIINSEELHKLFISEVKEITEIKVVNNSLQDNLIYYSLISYRNQIRYDEVFIQFSLSFSVNISFDMFSILELPVIEKVIGITSLKLILKYLESEGINFTTAVFNNYENSDDLIDYEIELINEDILNNSFPENILQNMYNKLDDYEKAAFYLLHSYTSSFLLPILFIQGSIDTNELIEIIKAINNKLKSKQFPSKSLFTDLVSFKDNLDKIETFLRINRKDSLFSIIENGENKQVEFKSTLRYDIRQQKINKHLEHEVLKSINAMLNTKGGELFIGVEDDGSIYGIEADNFKNDDKYLLHLNNLIYGKLIPNITSLLDIEIVELSNKKVCWVKCSKSQKPVYLINSDKEEFYVRTGPNSRRLKLSDTMEYVKQNFPDF